MSPLSNQPPTTSQVSPRTLIFGCGYLGRRVAQKLVFSSENVWATTRSQAKAQTLAQAGIQPVVADWLEPSTLGNLPAVERMLVAVSYDRASAATREQSQLGGLKNLLQATDPTTRICYISTTGVYDQRDGQWVDELAEARPKREGGRVHLQAEQLLAEMRPEGNWTILRLAGIYGPDRVPRIQDVIDGRPIASAQDGFLNLIHVNDAAAAVVASWSKAVQRLYVVADDCPVVRGEFYREVARQCEAPEPTFVASPPESSKQRRSESNKRVRNTRMKRDLVPSLQFPSYREGLSDVLQSFRNR